MIIGYARTSTVDQMAGFESQITELQSSGCEKVFQEQVSSVGNRAQLDAALEFVREGDVLVVTKLDRLMLTILGGIAQFEREMMLERQREGVAKAKGEGKYTGRKPIDTVRQAAIIRLNVEGLTKAEIANQVGVGEATVYRVLAKAKKS